MCLPSSRRKKDIPIHPSSVTAELFTEFVQMTSSVSETYRPAQRSHLWLHVQDQIVFYCNTLDQNGVFELRVTVSLINKDVQLRADHARNPHNLFVNRLCTSSNNAMSCLKSGDQITQLYSSSGRCTYVVKHRLVGWHVVMKQNNNWIIFALWW